MAHTGQIRDGGKSLLRADLQGYEGASNLMFNEHIRNLQRQGHNVYHLAFGQAPFPVIETATQALKEHAGQNAYLPVAGIPELRSAIVKFHAKYDGMTDLDPDDLVVGPGSKELIFLLETVLDTTVFLISPSWTTYKPQASLAGRHTVVIPTDLKQDWKLTPDLLTQAVEKSGVTGTKLLVINNPDNPTGTCYDKNDLQALSDTCRKLGMLVLSDEIYARLHYSQSHVSIRKFYPEGTILSTGLSKWASAGGWRVGYHIFPACLKEVRRAVISAGSHTFSCAPAPMQYAAANMFNDEAAVENYIRHTTRIMAAVADYCYRTLTAVGVKVLPAKGGYYIFPDFALLRDKLAARGINTCQQMCSAILEEASVALMAGGPAFLRPVEELTTRLCFVNFDGTDGLACSRKLGLDTPLPDTFVAKYCAPLYQAIQALAQWVQTQLDS